MQELKLDAEKLCFNWGHIPESEDFFNLLAPRLKQKYDIDFYKIGAFLGKGSFGGAYKYGANQVLKMTTDPTEISTSAILVGKDTKYICHIDRVLAWPKELTIANEFKINLNNPWNKNSYPMGWILQEYLPGKIGKNEMVQILGLIMDGGSVRKKVISGQMSKEEFVNNMKEWSKNYRLKSNDVESIIGMILEPIEYEIKFWDYQDGNIKRDSKGNIKVFDIGLSKSPGTKAPEEIKLEYLLKILKK